MSRKTKLTGRAKSMGMGVLLGTLLGMGITIAGAMIGAAMISRGTIPEQGIGYCSAAIILISSILGPVYAAGLIKHRRVYVCAITSLIYYGALLAITALFFGGQYKGMGVTALLVAGGCGVSILMGMKGEGKRAVRRVKIAGR